MTTAERKLEQAIQYVRRLALRDRQDRFPRKDPGIVWSAERTVRRQFAYQDQQRILRTYHRTREGE